MSTLPARSDPRSSAPASAPRSTAATALVAVYGILALAAVFRSGYQIATKFEEAPLAYALSALAGAVYALATVALARRRGVWLRVAWITLIFELLGVLVVGALSFLAPAWFAHPSVWSWFGAGYLGIPLALPILGLVFLARERATARAS